MLTVVPLEYVVVVGKVNTAVRPSLELIETLIASATSDVSSAYPVPEREPENMKLVSVVVLARFAPKSPPVFMSF